MINELMFRHSINTGNTLYRDISTGTNFTVTRLNNAGIDNYKISQLLLSKNLTLFCAEYKFPIILKEYLDSQCHKYIDSILINELLKNKTLWFGLPYLNMSELSKSPTVGCVSLLNRVTNVSILGLFPYFSHSSDVEYLLDQIIGFLTSNDKKIGCIGGDHKITWSMINSIKRVQNRDIVYIHFDAHNDLYGLDDENPTKIINHANFLLDLIEKETIDKVYLIGCRDNKNHQILQNKGVPIHGVYENFSDFENNIDCKLTDHVHLSVDIDILDPKYAPSVTNPIESGWSLEHLLSFLTKLLSLIHIDSFSFAEVCDIDAVTLESANRILSLLNISHELYDNSEKTNIS